MQRARLGCAHFEQLRSPAKSVGIQEYAGVAVDNIAEIRRLGYIIAVCWPVLETHAPQSSIQGGETYVFSWRYEYG